MCIPSRNRYRYSSLLKICLAVVWVSAHRVVAGVRPDGIITFLQDPNAVSLFPFPSTQPGAACETVSITGLGTLDGEYSLMDPVYPTNKPRWIRAIPNAPPFMLSWLTTMEIWAIGTRGSGRYNAFVRDKSDTPPPSSSSWEIFDQQSTSFKKTGTIVDISCPACKVVSISALEGGLSSCNGAYHRRFEPDSCSLVSWSHVAEQRCTLYSDGVGRAIVIQSRPLNLRATTDDLAYLPYQKEGPTNCTSPPYWWDNLLTESNVQIDEHAEARCSSAGKLTRLLFRLREAYDVDQLAAITPETSGQPRFVLTSPQDGVVVSSEQANIHLSISIDDRIGSVSHSHREGRGEQHQQLEPPSVLSALEVEVTVDGVGLPSMPLGIASTEGIAISLHGLEGTNVIEMCLVESQRALSSTATASSDSTRKEVCFATGTIILEIFSSETHMVQKRRSLVGPATSSRKTTSRLATYDGRATVAPVPKVRRILFIVDLEVVDGFKLSTLHLMKHLPDGFLASMLDLSCASGNLPMKALLEGEKSPLTRMCIQFPREIWQHAERERGGINNYLYSVLSRAKDWSEFERGHPILATSLGDVRNHLTNFDTFVMSNGAKDADAYLLHLARLAGVQARVVNLGALAGGYTSPFFDGATILVGPSHYVAYQSAVDRLTLGLPIKICYPVIDLESILQSGSSCSGGQQALPRVMFIMVSRVASVKTPGVFVRAIGALRRRQFAQNKTVEGVLAGTGSLLGHMEALSRDQEADVRFIGFVSPDAVPCQILQATALVVPSFSPETFGMVIPEAMILGVPVVTFGFGGSGELMRHMENGIVVSEPTPRGLADSLQLLAEDRALRDRLGARARRDALRLLHLPDMIACHVDAMSS